MGRLRARAPGIGSKLYTPSWGGLGCGADVASPRPHNRAHDHADNLEVRALWSASSGVVIQLVPYWLGDDTFCSRGQAMRAVPECLIAHCRDARVALRAYGRRQPPPFRRCAIDIKTLAMVEMGAGYRATAKSGMPAHWRLPAKHTAHRRRGCH